MIDLTKTEELIRISPNQEGFCVSIETSGSCIPKCPAINVLRPNGIVICLGLMKIFFSVSPDQFIHKKIRF